MEDNCIWVSGIGSGVASESFQKVEVAALKFADDSEQMKKKMNEVNTKPISACGTVSGVVDFTALSELSKDFETMVEVSEERPKVNRQTSFGGLFNKKGNKRW